MRPHIVDEGLTKVERIVVPSTHRTWRVLFPKPYSIDMHVDWSFGDGHCEEEFIVPGVGFHKCEYHDVMVITEHPR